MEKFIKEEAYGILSKDINESIGADCEALIDDEHKIQFFGTIYANDPSQFKFHRGDIKLIKELAAHVKKEVDPDGAKNEGLYRFKVKKPKTKCLRLHSIMKSKPKLKVKRKEYKLDNECNDEIASEKES